MSNLKKSRRRDQRARDYGDYYLLDPDRNAIIFGETDRQDEIEAWLEGTHPIQVRRGQSAGESQQ